MSREGSQHQRTHGLGLVVIDYLGGAGYDQPGAGGGFHLHGLKALAKVEGTLLARSAVPARGDWTKKPTLADLRYPGGVRRDADIVAMLPGRACTARRRNWKVSLCADPQESLAAHGGSAFGPWMARAYCSPDFRGFRIWLLNPKARRSKGSRP